LIAAEGLAAFSARGCRQRVTVATPAADALRGPLTAEGASVRTEDGLLVVTGLDAGRVGEIAQRHGIPLSRLQEERPSLEEAFMRLTAEAVQYPTGDAR
ncbi:ABC transporter ATP-binding protein, partial [Streptomyces sp. UH6]|nr:ABC transporter ATP-binding protein [Streptomyces sp. UH6]